MNKSIIHRLLLILLMVATTTVVSAANRLSLGSVNLEPGETRQLAFVLDNSQEFFGFQADITLPDGLEFVKVGDRSDFRLSNRTDESYTTVSSFQENGNLRVGAFSTSHNAINGDSGVLFYVGVHATEEFNGGTLVVSNILFADEDDKDVTLSDFSVEIGTVHSNTTYIPDFDIAVGETKTLSLFLNNETQFTAFQIDLYLPTGIEIIENSFKLTSRAADNHTISEKSLENGMYRIVCMSLSNGSFTDNSGALFTFEVKAGKDVEEKATIQLKNQLFSTPKAKEFLLPDAITNLTSERALVQSIELNEKSLSLVVGDTYHLTAEVLPEYASTKEIEWSSSNETIATVINGDVVAVGIGKATIKASAIDGSGVSAECEVTVRTTPVESIVLSSNEVSLKVGASATITAIVGPETATDKAIVWSSADAAVATVEDGVITARALGQTTVMATAADGSGVYAECTVNVVATSVESIAISQATAELKAGETVQLTAAVAPEDATDKTITWSSSNEAVATIDAEGLVTAVSVGEATITATASSGVKSECEVTVVATPVESITLSQNEVSLKVGASATVTAIVGPETATDKGIVWSSADTAVATVEDGVITAHALGQTTVRATAADGSGIYAECTVNVVATAVESIAISQTTAELKAGETVQLTAAVAPEDATDKTITWSSSNEAVATIDAEGLVTAVSVGEATITATASSGVKSECEVTVVATPVESITLSQSEVSLKVGASATITAIVGPETATDKAIVWSSADAAVATVEDGVITAHALGQTTVRATAADGSGVYAECTVNVVATAVESIAISQATAELRAGETVQLTASLAPDDATDKTITWSSSNEAVATIDAEGLVTAVSVGEATITATASSGVKAECAITVLTTPVEWVSIDQEDAEIRLGDELQLSVTVGPEDATDKSVVWTSSDETIATVNSEGNVTAVGIGTTKIIATAGSISDAITITVIAPLAISIEIVPAEIAGVPGDSFVLTATVLPAEAADQILEWSTSDTGIVKVSQDGSVEIVGEGEAVITVSTTDGSNLSATCSVSGVSGIDAVFVTSESRVDIYNLSGVLIQYKANVSDFNRLPAGVYIAKGMKIIKK